MTLTEISSIETIQDDSFLKRILGMHDRTDFIIQTYAYKYEGDGEYIDDNGILWSVAALAGSSGIITEVIMSTIKPQKTLRVSKELIKT